MTDQELIQALRMCSKVRCQDCLKEHTVCYRRKWMADAAIRLETLLAENKQLCWIPVTERMPEKEGSYLIFTTVYFTPDHVDDCDHYDGITISGYHPEFGFMGNNGLFAKAWMPLPEPPKEDA